MLREASFTSVTRIIAVAGILILASFSSLDMTSNEASAYTTHAPIYIDGNDDFIPANGVTSGSGTISDPYIIEGWDINASTAHGIEMYRTDAHFVIRNVNIHDGFNEDWPHYDGISLYYVSNGTVERSTFTNNDMPVRTNWPTNFLINNNTVYGRRFYPTSQGEPHGIFVARGENVTVSNNWLTSFHQGGIWITGFSDNIRVKQNHVTKSTYGIILAQNLTNSAATRNVLVENEVGMWMIECSGDSAYHNTFISNIDQARDEWGGSNSWDNGYPLGGNYWSDYSGNDIFHGPDQDLPGGDGIGDTPYDIFANAQDRYPLMSPLAMPILRPPIILQADLTGMDSRDVRITWSLSPDDGEGSRSVVGYEIFRNSSFDSHGLGYQLIASIPNGTSSYVDAFGGEGDPNDYFYRICAVTLGNRTSCAKDQAGKFTRPLQEGPILVSIPLIQSDESILTVLQTVAFDKAWTYEAFRNRWISYMTFKPYKGELKTIDNKMGVWVNVTRESNLTVAGIVPSSTLIQLHTGWNLVGFPSFNISYTVGNLKAETGATRVEGYDQAVEPYYLRVLDDGDILQPGYGYWVYVEADTAWIVDNS